MQVHQIRTEIQNENLRQAQTISKIRRKDFRSITISRPWNITTEKTGKIIEANVTAAEILGVEKNDLAARFFNAFVHPEDINIFLLPSEKSS